MKTINKLAPGVLLAAFTGVFACSTTPTPKDLTTARATFERASHGAAAQFAAADLHSAKETLDIAENSFTENGDTQATTDLAYTATRRAELAEAHARTVQAVRAKTETDAQLHLTETSNAQHTTAELGTAKTQLAMQGQQLQASGQQLVSAGQALKNETERREEAEKRAAKAAADLGKFASVKQETRGMVITLSGSVLFATAKSDLLPTAQVKLNEVADVLTKQDPDSKLVVEGHTDSQGGAAYNQELSQRRAQSVRDYLVSRGMASDRITAQGFGPTRAIADNASAEGRANNRRVEIVVQK